MLLIRLLIGARGDDSSEDDVFLPLKKRNKRSELALIAWIWPLFTPGGEGLC